MHPWPTEVQKIRLDGLITGDMVSQKCVVVEIDRQKKLLHTGSDLGDPDLKRENVACAVPLQTVKSISANLGK